MPLDKKQKEIIKTLSESDKVFRDGNVYFISLRPTNYVDNYNIVVFDDNYKYSFTIKDVKAFDFRMLRKVYRNVYYWREEMDVICPTSHAQQAIK